jgi:hypothetical protein
MAAAGLWCAPKDLVAFAQAVQTAIEGGPGALLARDTARLLVTPAYPEISESMAIGFFLSGAQPGGQHDRFGHGGADHGFLTGFSADISGHRAAAAMVHSFAGGPAAQAAMKAAGAAIGWTEPETSTDPGGGVDQQELMAALADPFTTDDGRTFKLQFEGGLSLIAPEQPPLPLEMVSLLNWTSRLGLTVSFEVDGGRITGLSIHQAGTTLKAKRSA